MDLVLRQGTAEETIHLAAALSLMMQVVALFDAAECGTDEPDEIDPDEAHADDGIRGKGKVRDKDVPHELLLGSRNRFTSGKYV